VARDTGDDRALAGAAGAGAALAALVQVLPAGDVGLDLGEDVLALVRGEEPGRRPVADGADGSLELDAVGVHAGRRPSQESRWMDYR